MFQLYFVKKYWMILLFIILVTLILATVFNHSQSSTDENGWEQSVEAIVDEPVPKETTKVGETISMFVDVKGEVMMPGVYEADSTNRVLDLIELAGGFTALAERDAVNLAQKIKDEMVIYVPTIGEANLPNFNGENTLVNINVASQSELETLPGIGPSKAQAIITYREEHGPFNSIEDLGNVSGIGEKSFEKLRELISVQ